MTKPARFVRAYLSVGSNVEPEKNVLKASDLLKKFVSIERSSSFFWTEPIGRPEQPMFLNGVWMIRTNIDPLRLKSEVLQPIETELGRVRTEDKWAERTIDLDILIYGNQVVKDSDLTIPDPHIYTWAFLAKALQELDRDLILPDTGQSITSVAERFPAIPMTVAKDFTHQIQERLSE